MNFFIIVLTDHTYLMKKKFNKIKLNHSHSEFIYLKKQLFHE